MGKLLEDKDLFFNIHSLIRFKASDLSDEVRLLLIDHFGMFLAEQGSPEETTDIVLSAMERDMASALNRHLNQDNQPFKIKQINEEMYIVSGYRGVADIAFTLSSPVKVFYTVRKGCAGKLFDCLMLCTQFVLFRKKGFLFHGAVLCTQHTCLMLTGTAGSGKTLLALSMLRDGWDYLSDDKFILHDKSAYIFRKQILLRDFHYQTFPWLSGISTMADQRHWLRKRLKQSAIKHLPGYLYARIERILDPFFLKDPLNLFPERKIIQTARLKICVLLQPGFEFTCAEIDLKTALKKLSLIQWLDSPLLETLARQLFLYGYENFLDIDRIIEANLEGNKVFEMTIPAMDDIGGLSRKINQCLRQVL